MTSLKSFRANLSIFIGMFLIVASVSAADWPTYRYDNARTGCTSESLTAPLSLQWIYTPAHPPRPAWSGPANRPREGFELRHRVIFDDAYQVAAVDNTVYFGSSSDDKVYALDAVTGDERWSFFTGGPVRLAPVVCEGRVFVGSDDGFVYCLNANNGNLIWKVRGGPNNEKLLGSGRMISRWPIRTGVLVDSGIAYFGAGIFPHENVYLCAVQADDGMVIWKNDCISEQDAYRKEFTPQGYLLATGTRLFAPSGRALPVGFDRATGSEVFSRSYGWRGEQAGGAIGGTYALLADEQIYTGTQQHLLALNQNTGRVGFGWFPGRRLAVVGNMAYMATGRQLMAMDRTKYAQASGRRNSLEYKIKSLRSSVISAKGEERKKQEQQLKAAEEELKLHRSKNIEPIIRWRVPSQCDAELILTANLVFAGGQDQVNAFRCDNGQAVWKAHVNGKARGLAVANGRLYVSTDTGKIYCFAAKQAAKSKNSVPDPRIRQVANPYPQDELTAVYEAAAEAIVMETGVTKGYCLVVGAENGRLAWELAQRTDLTIIGVEPDKEKVTAARLALDAAGLYGQRVTIDEGNLSKLPYSNYFANLIVSDSLLLTGNIPGIPEELLRHLKPCGGAICLGAPANASGKAGAVSSEQLSQWLKRLELGQCRISQTNGCWATLRRGALPGAGKWTHQYAGPGNTACSDDRIVAGPLGLLWFGDPGPAPMVNRHNAAAAPLAVNGRLFVQGENVVMAYDSYNGVLLWKRDIPGAMRTRLKRSECGNLAVCEDSFFVALDDKCLRLDAETGQTLQTYNMPPVAEGGSHKWGYLAYIDDILYGSTMKQVGVSDSVFAIDTRSGETLWNYQGKNIINLTIAVGDGWLFFIDSSLTPEQREKFLRQDKSHLLNLSAEEAKKAEAAQKELDVRLAVALDAQTGGKLWERAVDVTDCSNIGIGGGELTAMYHDGVVVLCGANANGHYWSQFLSGEFSNRRLVALSAKSGDVLWAKDANYRHRPLIIGGMVLAEPWAFDLKTGQQRTRSHPLTGAETTWQFLRPGHHCGAISACPQMLLMRSGYTSYYDLQNDSGIRHFAGHRLGCWINAIPADGLVLAPEASAGCICLFPIVCSIALEPRPDYDRWGIYSTGGANTPVKHLALNLGAPGDRRDRNGRLWFGYPRPELPQNRAAMGFSLKLGMNFLKEPDYIRRNSEIQTMSGTDTPWLFASGARGLRRCIVPLLSEADEPAEYTVRLYFADFDNEQAGKRIFDIKLQGQVVLDDFDIVREAGGSCKAVVRQFRGIAVSDNLKIELVAQDEKLSSKNGVPVLCGVEVVRERKTAKVATTAHARQ
ncbi:MAG TPA: PQQ-binding-like beta-propeller repeat protein [Sedimentisphaerales bacterium]|nr:PQQ-binding-like beta-propeller repeat protein [Sedimentisphaerales bacterium]